jgi:hypothetical protein
MPYIHELAQHMKDAHKELPQLSLHALTGVTDTKTKAKPMQV